MIDLYSVKPLDEKTLSTATKETTAVLTVEDHYAEGGVGEAVRNKPRSGPSKVLLDQAEISSKAVVEKVKALL